MIRRKIKIRSFYILTIILSLGMSSCLKDLDVPNPNEPGSDRIYDNPRMVMKVAQSSYYKWWNATNTDNSPRMAMWVMADQGTCSWANRGMYHLSSEPRAPFNNDPSYTYASINENFWKSLYAAYFMANGCVRTIEQDSMKIEIDNKDNTALTLAFSHFVRGLSIGYLGLVYDQGAITDPETMVMDTAFKPYSQLIDDALYSLDKVIEICSQAGTSFEIPSEWINGKSYSNSELAKLAYSYAARFMVYKARTKAECEAADWAKIKEYAEAGIDEDIEVLMDNDIWKSLWRRYTVRPGWARIDARIIHLMDNSYPWRFPDNGVNPEPASSADGRLASDFNFDPSCNMKPERGYYHYSNYEYARYDYAYNNVWEGDVPEFLAYENELIIAEAKARLGDIAGALDIINNGPRTDPGRGNLPPATASTLEELLEVLFYERDIELIQTGFGIAFFDMRRRDMLQKGTMLHFPVPGKELNTLSLPNYTYGGEANADGINTSNGGWFPNK